MCLHAFEKNERITAQRKVILMMNEKNRRIDFPGKNKRRMQLHSEEASTELFGFNMMERSDRNTLITGDGSSAVTPRASEDPTAEFVGLYTPDQLNVRTEYPDGIPGFTDKSGDGKKSKGSDRNDKSVKSSVNEYRKTGKQTDPLGSWTGNPDGDEGEVPVQDADDL